MFHGYLCPTLLQFPAFYCVKSISFHSVSTLIADLTTDPLLSPPPPGWKPIVSHEKKGSINATVSYTEFLERGTGEVTVIVTELQRVRFSQMNSRHPLFKSLRILRVLRRIGFTVKQQFTERHLAPPPVDSAWDRAPVS